MPDSTTIKGRREPKVYTAGEQKEMLKEYVELTPDLWAAVRAGTHVRYVTRDGEFRRGGLVQGNPSDFTPKGDTKPKRFMWLDNGMPPPRAVRWAVAYDTIAHLYAKPDAFAHLMLAKMSSLAKQVNERNHTIVKYARGLEERLAALEKSLGVRADDAQEGAA